MFRKIHSNRDSKDTLWSELRKEFAGYISRADERFRHLCLTYPRQVYTAMVLLLIISIVLSFWILRQRKSLPVLLSIQKDVHAKPASDGFVQISQKAAALQETALIKAQIEKLIAKDSLDHRDSVMLTKAIDRFHELSIYINP